MPDSPVLFSARVQAVLQEVQFIRQEILDNVSRVNKIQASALSLYGALFTFSWLQKDFRVLLCGPILVGIFTFIWLACQSHLDASSFYLREEIEKRKWPELLGMRSTDPGDAFYRRYWVGWQHYFDISVPSAKENFVIPFSVWFIGFFTFIVGLIGGYKTFPIIITVSVGIAELIILVYCLWKLIKQAKGGTFHRFRDMKEIHNTNF